MNRTVHRLWRTAYVAAIAALLVATMVLPAGAAQAAGRPAPVAAAPAPTRACADEATGSVTCLASFRSTADARRAGTPANPAGRAALAAGLKPQAVAPPTEGYGPSDIKSIYSLDLSKGSGQTVAIVDAHDNPHAEKDLAVFRSVWKLPACTTANGCFRKVNQPGGKAAPAPDAGWGLEINLDLQAVSSTCPKCKLLLVEADSSSFDDIGAAVNQAVALGAKIVSNSYGGPEFNGVAALGKKYYQHPGVAMVVSSGDDGFTTAAFPAALPTATAVGGTSVTKTSGGWKQSAWGGAGSGCSAWFAKPSWQRDPNCLMRTVSDVSALADPTPAWPCTTRTGSTSSVWTPGGSSSAARVWPLLSSPG